MSLFGLIGFPLSHSFSKGYFADKFKREGLEYNHYENYPLASIEEFKDLVENSGLSGLNVTIPYKEAVIPFLNELDPEAQEIGAVNTIRIEDNWLKGYNTDVYGFVESLKPMLNARENYQALILGTGGASKAVAYGLKKLGIPYLYVSRFEREGVLSYNELSAHHVAEHELIINTTPLGMFPDIDNAPPIAYGSIGDSHILYDLVYNPAKTLFLEKGEEQGAQIKNGLEMLHLQAEKAWEIWND